MKNAIVTGATRGIGLATAEMLLKEGYHVTITYAYDEDSVQPCRERLSAVGNAFEILWVDQTNKQEMHDFALKMREKGHVDCIICNAGMTLRSSLQEIDEEGWERVMQMNVNSNVYLIRDLFDVIPNGSRIVFTGSLMGVLPHSVSLSYGVTKAAVLALAKNLVKFFEGTNTTVNAIAPGFVETDWQKNKPQEIRNNIYNKTAIKRFAEPEEIADAVRFCINNAFVNGSVIEVSGGYCFK
jgi:3-oxoacyl-[acyl-carrier protein] reductase